jgi:hypothetical protein
MTLYVYPPSAAGLCTSIDKPIWYATDRVTHRTLAEGPCVSLEDGIAKAEAWLAERERQEKPLHSMSLGSDGSATVFNASGKVIGRTFGTVTKPTGHLPCNCGAPPDSPFDWHHRDCNSRMCEVSLQPTKYGTDGYVKAGERESDDAYRKRLIEHFRRTNGGEDPHSTGVMMTRVGSELDRVGINYGIRRHGSDLPTNAEVKANANGDAFDGNWTVYNDLVKQAERGIGRAILGVDPAHGKDSTRYHEVKPQHGPTTITCKPSLRERLARELRLDPCADEEVVFGTAAKRLAAPLADLNAERERSKRLTADINVANRMRETVINKLSDLEIRCRNQSIQLGEMSETIRMQAREIERLKKGGKR